jgi:hypothetical protein
MTRNGTHPPPPARTTSLGVTLAVSGAADGEEPLHASISLPGSVRDLELLCELAAWAFPQAPPEHAPLLGAGVLHLLTPLHVAGPDGDAGTRSRELYGCVARRLQGTAEAEAEMMPEEAAVVAAGGAGAGEDRRIYFGVGVR